MFDNYCQFYNFYTQHGTKILLSGIMNDSSRLEIPSTSCNWSSVSHNLIIYMVVLKPLKGTRIIHNFRQLYLCNMLSVEIIKLAIIVKQKRDIGSTYALSKCRFFLISAKVERSLLLRLKKKKWKSHSLQRPIFKNYHQFLTDLFSNETILSKLWKLLKIEAFKNRNGVC